MKLLNWSMNRYSIGCILYLCFGACLYGYDSGLTSSIIAYPEFIAYYDFDSTTLGALGSTHYAGNFVGCVANSWLPDRLGRIQTIQLASIISLLGAGMQTGAQSLGVLLAGRAIGGVATGIIVSLCPMFLTEISPPHVRGRVGGLYNVNIGVSYMIAGWMGLGFSYLEGDFKFRVFIGLQLFCAVFMLAGSFFIPESPRWLVIQSRQEQALRVLERLHRPRKQTSTIERNDDDELPFYRREFFQIEAQLRLESETTKLGVTAIWRRPSYRRRLFIIVFFFAFQQLTGIIALQNYQSILYRSLGVGPKVTLVLVGTWSTVVTIDHVFGAMFFDKWGRRKNFFFCMVFIIIGSVLLVAFWAQFEAGGETNKTLGSLAVWSMYVFVIGYAWNMNSFGYAYAPEILPMNIRAVGVSAGFATLNAVMILIVQVAPIAMEAISWRFYLIFIVCDVIFVAVVYFAFPETANVPLEEVARLFGDEVAVTLEHAGHSKDVKGAEVELREESK